MMEILRTSVSIVFVSMETSGLIFSSTVVFQWNMIWQCLWDFENFVEMLTKKYLIVSTRSKLWYHSRIKCLYAWGVKPL